MNTNTGTTPAAGVLFAAPLLVHCATHHRAVLIVAGRRRAGPHRPCCSAFALELAAVGLGGAA